jgi:hypothetical protein
MTEFDTIARDEVNRKSRDEMSRLMLEHGLFIPAREFHTWRPTKRTTGDIQGVVGEVEIVATNGLLAYYLTATQETFFGHIQKFSGKVEPLFSVPKPKKETKRKPRQKSKVQQALDLL